MIDGPFGQAELPLGGALQGKLRDFGYRWRPARGPLSRRERAGSEVTLRGPEWNLGRLAWYEDTADGSQPWRIEVRDTTEIYSSLMDG